MSETTPQTAPAGSTAQRLVILTVLAIAIPYCIPNGLGVSVSFAMVCLAAFCLWRTLLCKHARLGPAYAMVAVLLAIVGFANVYFMLHLSTANATHHFRVPADARISGGLRQRAARQYLGDLVRSCEAKLSEDDPDWENRYSAYSSVSPQAREAARDQLVKEHFELPLEPESFGEVMRMVSGSVSNQRVRDFIGQLCLDAELYYEVSVEPPLAEDDSPFRSAKKRELWEFNGIVQNSASRLVYKSYEGHDALKRNLLEVQDLVAKEKKGPSEEPNTELLELETEDRWRREMQSVPRAYVVREFAIYYSEQLRTTSWEADRRLYLGSLVFSSMLYLTAGYSDMVPNSDVVLWVSFVNFLVYVWLGFVLIPQLLRQPETDGS